MVVFSTLFTKMNIIRVFSFVFVLLCLPEALAKDVKVRSLDEMSSVNPNDQIVITSCLDLKGNTIKLPRSSTLSFYGGYIKNGTIIGNDSNIKADKSMNIFQDVVLSGSWKVMNSWSSWFDFSDTDAEKNTRNFKNLCMLTDSGHKGVVTVTEGRYPVMAVRQGDIIINPNSNTTLIIDGEIILCPNPFKNYAIISIRGKQNVTISGSGKVVGDVDSHTGTEGEWGMGIEIISSSDILIKNLTVKKMLGRLYLYWTIDT